MMPQPPIPIMKAIQIFRGILKGVFYLHSRGIVHGDLKVSNVMLENTWEELPGEPEVSVIFEAPSTPTLSGPGSPSFLADSFGCESPWSPKPIYANDKRDEEEGRRGTPPDQYHRHYERYKTSE